MTTTTDEERDERWPVAPREIAYAAGEVHVWRLDLSRANARDPRFWSWLSQDEQQRASRFVFARDRDRFVLARAGLRQLLGAALGLAPQAPAFAANDYGKLRLAAGGGPAFNLSHSGERALYAVACDREVGVDVEAIRADLARDGDVTQFFSAAEIADLRALPAAAQVDGFFACWTRKEAYIKGRGMGLSMPLDRFRVSLDAAHARLVADDDDPTATARWHMHTLSAGRGYAAAVAADGPFTLHQWELDLGGEG